MLVLLHFSEFFKTGMMAAQHDENIIMQVAILNGEGIYSLSNGRPIEAIEAFATEGSDYSLPIWRIVDLDICTAVLSFNHGTCISQAGYAEK